MGGGTSELAPGTRMGPYVIESTIGVGGMATVYLARREGLDRKVALKTLHPHVAAMPTSVERFVQEARATSALRHRHVIEVIDVGTAAERPYLVMELLQGETLADRLVRMRRMSTEAIADVLLPVVSAVSAAHASGIVHRDLKPDNVIVARDAEGERPVLLDFGISKILEGPRSTALTQVGQVVGTPYYMAPEQIRREELDTRTDQYAIGVILFECSTGVRPFRTEQSLFVLMAEILLGHPQLPSHLEPSIPPSFERLILRAMAARREDRFSSMNELGRALLPFASGDLCRRWARSFGADPDDIEPIAASRPSAGALPPIAPLSTPPSGAFDPALATQPAVPSGRDPSVEQLHLADLRALPVLADLPDAALEGFCLVSSGRKYPAGRALFAQGASGDGCLAILHGRIEITKEMTGTVTVLDVLESGAFVGQDALIERTTRSVTARAAEESLVIELNREEMQRLLGFHDQVALRFLELIAVSGIRQLRDATKKLATLLEERATGRKADGSEVTATRPLEQLRAAVREWSVKIEDR